jgi:WD40 repeat protein
MLGRRDATVHHVAWLDGKRVTSAAADGTLAVWHTDGTPEGLFWNGHNGPAYSVVASPGCRVLVSGGADGVMAVWDLAGEPLARIPFPGRVREVAAHPALPLIACVGDGGLVHLGEILGVDTW